MGIAAMRAKLIWRPGRWLPGLWLPGLMLLAQLEWAAAAGCTRSDFEAVVDQASAALGALNRKNKPAFQSRLRLLKAKRGWSHDQFLKNAAPFVRDKKIAVLDASSQQALEQINALGQEGGDAAVLDCTLLPELRAHMKTLVETQKAKWVYMFAKIDGALGK